MANLVEIRLDRPIFFPGDLVTGRVEAVPIDGETLNVRRVEISVNGLVCSESKDAVHLMRKLVIFPTEKNQFPADTHWNFEFPLPSHCPPTFHSEPVQTTYFIRTKLIIPFSDPKNVSSEFTVAPWFDFTQIPGVDLPVSGFVETKVGWLKSRGIQKLSATIPSSGYSHGDTIHVSARFENESSRVVAKASATFFRLVSHKETFFGMQTSVATVEKKKESTMIHPGTFQNFDWSFTVPPLTHTIRNSSLLAVEYFIAVRIGNARVKLPFVIGTRPEMPKVYHQPSVSTRL